MSQKSMAFAIAHAQQHIDDHKAQVSAGVMRQEFHFMGQTGWINDPNGLIWFRGQYHIFYQFNPYSGFWGRMFWGHAVSDDLFHWRYLPIALAPSEWYDDHPQGGCFSGSAIVKDDRLYLLYTGTSNNGRGFEQNQCLAWSDDGIHFSKYEGNPIISAPEGVSHDFFRDPKVWEHEGAYYLICGAQRHGQACVLLYRSDDLINWQFLNTMAESRGEWGYMWECPDFFQLGDRYVLICSPMGAGERTVVYFIGDFDYRTGRFSYNSNGEIDWGFDFYAPQTFLDGAGRRIMLAWANCWDWMPFWKDWGPTYREGWCGSFCLPREVRLEGGDKLAFEPVRELSLFHIDPYESQHMLVGTEPTDIPVSDGVHYDLTFSIDLASTTADVVELHMRADKQHETVCYLDLKRALMVVDRNRADGWSKGATRSTLTGVRNGTLSVRIVSDRTSLEIFADEGRVCHSLNIFPKNGCKEFAISTQGGEASLLDLQSYGVQI